MNCLYKRFSKNYLLNQLPKIFKVGKYLSAVLLLVLFFNINKVEAQATLYETVTVRISQVNWVGLGCDVDGIGSCLDSPEPRFRYNVEGSGLRYVGEPSGNPQSGGPGLSGTATTGSASVSALATDYLYTATATCDNQISFTSMRGHEDDGCGNGWTYNTGCINDDDALATFSNQTYSLSAIDGGANVTYSAGNYGMSFRLDWEVQNAPLLSVTPPVICSGETADLSCAAPNSGTTVVWFTNNASPATSIIGSGLAITTPAITTFPYIVYFAEATSATGTCTGESGSVTITETTMPTAPTLVAPASLAVCNGETLDLEVGPSALYTVAWYTDLSNPAGTQVSTGVSYTTPGITTFPTIYYVSYVNGSCYGAPLTVTITEAPAPPAPLLVSPASLIACSGETVSLEVEANALYTVAWYTNIGNPVGSQVGSGIGYTTPSLTVFPATYFVSYVNGTCYGAPLTVTITEDFPPAAPTAMGAQTCLGGSVELMATVATMGATILWYDADPTMGGVAVGSGAIFTTPAINLASEDWFVVGVTASGCEGPATEVIVTTDLPLTAPTVPTTMFCSGSSATVAATSGGASTGFFYWYADAALTNLLYVGNPYVTPTLTSPPTYYVTEDIDGCVTAATTVTLTMVGTPSTPVPDQDTVFTMIGGTATFSVSAALGPNEVYRWFDEDPTNGGSFLFEGNTLVSPPIFVNAEDFFVTITDTTIDCNNLRVAGQRAINGIAARVIAIANNLADAPTMIGDTICEGETATLMATPDSTGVIVWFSDASPVDSLGTGNSFTTPILAQTTSFFAAEYINDTLISAFGVATAVVNPKPTPPNVESTTTCDGALSFSLLDEQIGNNFNLVITDIPAGDTVFLVDLPVTANNLIVNIASGTIVPGLYTMVATITAPMTDCVSDPTIASLEVLALPVAPTITGDIEICEGESTDLMATGTGGQITWYSDAGLMTVVGTGVQFNTGALTATTTYYVTETTNNDAGCEGADTAVTVTVNAAPTAPTATNDSICAGETATLTAMGSGAGTLNWYADASGSALLGTGPSFTTPALTQTTTYYVGEISADGCESELTAADAVIRTSPNAPQAADIILCIGEAGDISATGSGVGELVWYNDALAEQERDAMPPATGAFEVGPFATVGTYIFYVTEDDGNCESELTEIEVVVVDAPSAAPTVSGDTEICNGESTILTAVGTGGNITWYSDTTGAGTIVATGGQFTTPALAVTTTYFVSESFGSCEGPAVDVVVTVNPEPNAPVAIGDSICSGSTATLTAMGSGTGTLNWYADASATVSIGTGTSYTTPALTQTTTYYVNETSTDGCVSELAVVNAVVIPVLAGPTMDAIVEACEGDVTVGVVVVDAAVGATLTSDLIDIATGDTVSNQTVVVTVPVTEITFTALVEGTYTHTVSLDDGNCSSTTTSQTIVINETPDAPTVLDTVEICSGETATLFAFGQVNNPNSIITWFDDANFDPIATGWEYETQPLTVNQTFYATITDENGCESEQATVAVIINELPVDPTVETDSVCAGEVATLTVTGNGGLYTWYNDGAGTNEVATGAVYTTPALAQNTTFYVSETNTTTGCASALIPVTAVVVEGPEAPTPQVGDITICVNETGEITATGSGTGSLIWYDGNQVQLEIDVMPPAEGSLTVGPFATAGTYFFYVSESDGNCESELSEIEVVVTEIPEAPTGQGDTICSGETATITAIGTGGVITWYADAALTTPISSGSQFTTDVLTTTTSYWATESFGSCEGPATEVEVVVNDLPETPTATSNAPICEGETLMLMASDAFGVTYDWTGPNGFSSSDQNPTIDNVSEANHQGVYTVTITDNTTGCQSEAASVNVDILPTPAAPSLSSNSPLCEGEDLVLTASSVAGGTFTFYDENNAVITTGTDNTATVTMISQAQAGTYGVSVNVDGCESAISTTVVVVKPRPNAPAVSNNGPVCENDDLVLIAQIITGATYTWIGPDSNVIGQNGPIITISPATLDDAGTYGVFITVDGCSSDTATTDAVVIAAPELTQEPTTNSPICEHDTLLLQAPYDSTLTYDWTGPNGFVPDTTYIDTVNNFYVEAVFDANENDHQGFYTLVVTDGTTGCGSKEYAVLVIINKFPDNVIADNNSPACEGDDVQLTVTSIVNAEYTWTGPQNYVSFDQNPVLENVTTDMEGTYEVTIILGGCVSMTVSTDVVIYANPIADAGEDLFIEEGTVFQLDGNGSTGAIDFAWLGEDQSWFDNPTSPNPWIGTNGPLPARDDPYVFVLTVYNEFGCTDQDTVLVTVFETTALDIPNIITPNGDGINDTWVIQYLDNLDNYVLSVYARGGTLLLKTSNYNNDWAGTNVDGDDLPEGTYWYTIHSDNESVFKGYVEIIR